MAGMEKSDSVKIESMHDSIDKVQTDQSKERQSDTTRLAEDQEKEEHEVEEEGDLLGEDSVVEYVDDVLLDRYKMPEDEFKVFLKPGTKSIQSKGQTTTNISEPLDGEDLLYDLMTKAGASVFVETQDFVCEQVLSILKSLSLSIYVIRMDLLEHYDNMKQTLFQCTGIKSLPVIFINGQLIGGYKDLWFLFYTDLINCILLKTPAPYQAGMGDYRSSLAFDYDIIVIGGGAAGISAAVEAAKLGKKVALINYVKPTPNGRTWNIGGTYLNVGSISKNLMYTASNFGQSFEGYGIVKTKTVKPNWSCLMEKINDYVKSSSFSLRCKLKENNIKHIKARARFVTDHSVEVTFPKIGEKRNMSASVLVVATGSRPRYPKFLQGALDYCCTTDDFFLDSKTPGKTLILTSTTLGLECATILANFGYPVTVQVEPPVLKEIDWEILRRVKSHMEFVGITFLEEVQIESIEPASNEEKSFMVKGYDGVNKVPFTDTFDTILIDYGRIPNTAHLGLTAIGIKVNNRTRKIIVDDEGRTNKKHIFALGDIVHGWPQLGSVAKKAGKMLIERLYKGNMRYTDLSFAPERMLFPVEYARIGPSEEAAKLRFGDRIKPYEADTHILESNDSPTRSYFYFKIICLQCNKKEEVIAVHILCQKSAEIIQGLSVLLKRGATRSDFEDMIALHPIFSEVVSNMKLKYFKTSVDVYKAHHEATKRRIALKVLEEVKPLQRSKKVEPKKLYQCEKESEESLKIDVDEKELERNKEPRLTKSMEAFIINTIIKGKDHFEETVEEEQAKEASAETLESEESSSSTSESSSSTTSVDESSSDEEESGNKTSNEEESENEASDEEESENGASDEEESDESSDEEESDESSDEEESEESSDESTNSDESDDSSPEKPSP